MDLSFCSGVNGGTATCASGATYLIQETPLRGGRDAERPGRSPSISIAGSRIARDTQGFDGSAVRAAKSYDALGRVAQTSRPYFVTNTPQ